MLGVVLWRCAAAAVSCTVYSEYCNCTTTTTSSNCTRTVNSRRGTCDYLLYNVKLGLALELESGEACDKRVNSSSASPFIDIIDIVTVLEATYYTFL
ncbi:hypothetical protein BDZ97DRAFT_1843805 [Flammula alnicola]|nr:hypothetical protein BDZ97DRAFT_1843805 [Flammula alnicola]